MNLILLQPILQAYDSEGNWEAIKSLVVASKGLIKPDDILLLPEHFTSNNSEETYLQQLQELARQAGCTIVGGSYHRRLDGKSINIGCILDGKGNQIGEYTKLRPYFNELSQVSPGDTLGEFTINNKNFLVLICADFWYSDLILKASVLPDVILVPSLSVSRKSTPNYSRSLWRHLAITRAYEFGAFIGISDWHENSVLPKYRTCGVGGFADPTSVNPEEFFRPVSSDGLSLFNLDFEKLEMFRMDRRMRGFYWKE